MPFSLRSFAPLAMLLLAPVGLGCSLAPEDVGDADATESSEAEISSVPQSVVERQSIGNCWIYAHASWLESLHQAATGETYDSSQSWQTYWHWFEQLVNGETAGEEELQTGGWFRTSNYLTERYGIAPEAAFIPEDVASEMSSRQKSALDRVNAEMKAGGRLATPTSRRNRRLVRQILDEAFQLSPEVRTQMNKVFGTTATRNLTTRSRTTGRLLANTEGTFIVRPTDFSVAYTRFDAATRTSVPVSTTLAQAMIDWRSAYYSTWNGRSTLIRVQRALHDRQPVVASWFVDFNAMSNFDQPGAPRGSFTKTLLDRSGPGRQGGHMTVFHDYEARLANGELLAAGIDLDRVADADKLEAALDPSTTIVKLRVKNSWGSARADRGFVPELPGYHDLHLDYLNGPIQACTETENLKPLEERGCTMRRTPLNEVILPPGY
ncbi:MAG: hypothetical protein JST00_10935 [Deltaproteobacteria bacterium]|nr:hypothetical protein [Deltaproteobacteria bacterium]